jgi:hypothetical protein
MDNTEQFILETIKVSLIELSNNDLLFEIIESLKKYEKIYRESEVFSIEFYKSIRESQCIIEYLGIRSDAIHPNEALAYVIQACKKAMIDIEKVKPNIKTHCPHCGNFIEVV